MCDVTFDQSSKQLWWYKIYVTSLNKQQHCKHNPALCKEPDKLCANSPSWGKNNSVLHHSTTSNYSSQALKQFVQFTLSSQQILPHSTASHHQQSVQGKMQQLLLFRTGHCP